MALLHTLEHERDLLIDVNGSRMRAHYLQGESQSEIAQRLSQKLVPREDLVELGNFLRKRSSTISSTTGAFDLIHGGHGRYISLAKTLGDKLVVGLNSDASIKSYKGDDRPIQQQIRRAEMLSFLEAIDYLTIYDEPTGAEVIRLVKPDYYLCVEGSWTGDLATKEEVKAMAEIHGEVFYTPRQDPHVSTTDIIGKMGQIIGKRFIEFYYPLLQNPQISKEELLEKIGDFFGKEILETYKEMLASNGK